MAEGGPGDPVEVLLGAGQVFLGHTALILVAMVLQLTVAGDGDWTTALFLMIGVSQLVYVVPILALAWTRDRRQRFWGAVGAAAVTLLLNGGCWGMVGASIGEL